MYFLTALEAARSLGRVGVGEAFTMASEEPLKYSEPLWEISPLGTDYGIGVGLSRTGSAMPSPEETT